ncbi:hypothetical protein lerEdw1_019330 [Lerista edwardsae]|nr:hypothetical protein lerEdw1_019330 [Lerista edwardsae]
MHGGLQAARPPHQELSLSALLTSICCSCCPGVVCSRMPVTPLPVAFTS